jgi:hypothetical protein
MYFVLGDRNALIQLVPKNAVWAEVGVYKGDFSQIVLDTCTPSLYYLISIIGSSILASNLRRTVYNCYVLDVTS